MFVLSVTKGNRCTGDEALLGQNLAHVSVRGYGCSYVLSVVLNAGNYK